MKRHRAAEEMGPHSRVRRAAEVFGHLRRRRVLERLFSEGSMGARKAQQGTRPNYNGDGDDGERKARGGGRLPAGGRGDGEMKRVNLMLDDETLKILDRMALATAGGAKMNRSSLVRALAKGADVLPDSLFSQLRADHCGEALAFLISTFLRDLASRAKMTHSRDVEDR